MNFKKQNMPKLFSIFILTSVIATSTVTAQEIKYKNPVKVDSLNSSAEESLPLYDVNNKTLYLVRTFHEGNTGGKKSGNEIWAFDKTENKNFRPSTYDFKNLNNKYSNAVVGINVNGKKLYLLNRYTPEGIMKPGVSTSVLKDKTWSKPKSLNIPGITDKTKIYNVFVNDDENMMLISMKNTTPDSTYGIYLSQKTGAKWGIPSLLTGINSTQSNEISPYLTKDNKFIYFASDRKGGQGDFDIYKAEIKENVTNWSEGKNVKALNSSSFDAYFSMGDKNNAYFASNRGGALADIYMTTVMKEEKDTAVAKKIEETDDAIVSAHPFVNFAFDKYTLNRSARGYLDVIADSLADNQKWNVQLDGHTDFIGSNSYNRELSKKRAISARDYLISKGVDPKRIDTRYFGEKRPKRSNETDYGRYMNRRVEITFKNK